MTAMVCRMEEHISGYAASGLLWLASVGTKKRNREIFSLCTSNIETDNTADGANRVMLQKES